MKRRLFSCQQCHHVLTMTQALLWSEDQGNMAHPRTLCATEGLRPRRQERRSPMQPHEQGTPAAVEHQAIRYDLLEGLFPPSHVFALNVAVGTLLHITQHEQGVQPLVLGEQQVTERERDLLLPLLDNYPHFTPIRYCTPACTRAMTISWRRGQTGDR
jgi:hypothetical protein